LKGAKRMIVKIYSGTSIENIDILKDFEEELGYGFEIEVKPEELKQNDQEIFIFKI
jgi:hypothetical protein